MNPLYYLSKILSSAPYTSGQTRDLIRDTIPHSVRAAVVLLVMLIFMGGAFGMLPLMFVSGHVTAGSIIKFIVCLAIGLPAMAAFYYFQGLDGNPATKDYKPLETLNKAEEARLKEERLRTASVTPAYPELDEAHKTDSGKTENL